MRVCAEASSQSMAGRGGIAPLATNAQVVDSKFSTCLAKVQSRYCHSEVFAVLYLSAWWSCIRVPVRLSAEICWRLVAF